MSYNHTTVENTVCYNTHLHIKKAQKKRSEILVQKQVGDETIISVLSRYNYNETVYTAYTATVNGH